MIKVFVLVGIIGGLVIAYLAVFAVGPISQLPPSQSLLTGFRAKGIVPASVNLEEDEAVEEAGVFEVPPQDKVNLKQIMAKGGSMPGMKMDGEAKTPMKMDGEAMAPMKMEDGAKAPMKMDGEAMAPMKMDGEAKAPMKMEAQADMKPAMEGESTAIVSDELKLGEGGLIFYEDAPFDREISLDMGEWKFSNMKIEVKAGERIKFTVKNKGQIPHEFMFMNMPLMSSVTYRATRADWSLIEHVALFEKALVLPGGEFTFVLKVNQPGSWNFMCMLPYHMQMGMMGQMATPGMATDMAM